MMMKITQAIIIFVFIFTEMSQAITTDIFTELFDYKVGEKTERPIIGVLAQETDRNVTVFGSQYVAATYVKFIESAGGRVVPIFMNSTEKQVEKLFSSINGAIFPGGHRLLHHTNYTRIGKQIFHLALKAFDSGEVFPIWAECLGFELVSMLVSKTDISSGQLSTEFFTSVDAENISLPLILPRDYLKASMWKSAPSRIVNFLRNNRVTYNNHKIGITPQTYHKNKRIRAFFRITSTSKDRKGVEFISMMQGKRYPIYMFHWHPGKAQFEWRRDLDINHSLRNVIAGQYFANYFIKEARYNSHHFPSVEEERAALIYNYKMTFVEDYLPVVQAYFF